MKWLISYSKRINVQDLRFKKSWIAILWKRKCNCTSIKCQLIKSWFYHRIVMTNFQKWWQLKSKPMLNVSSWQSYWRSSIHQTANLHKINNKLKGNSPKRNKLCQHILLVVSNYLLLCHHPKLKKKIMIGWSELLKQVPTGRLYEDHQMQSR